LGTTCGSIRFVCGGFGQPSSFSAAPAFLEKHMALRLTPAVIAGAYEFLRVTPPFCGWKLPPAEEVEFVVCRHRMQLGYHRGIRRKMRSHEIGISENCVGYTNTLLKTMAHEMIHQHQQRVRSETPNTEHNAEFIRLAHRICRYHGWDEKEFV